MLSGYIKEKIRKRIFSSKMNVISFLIEYLFPATIIMFGLFGNIMGLIVVSKKKLQKLGPVLIFKCLFISDTIYLGKCN
jgi:hypothetical protein